MAEITRAGLFTVHRNEMTAALVSALVSDSPFSRAFAMSIITIYSAVMMAEDGKGESPLCIGEGCNVPIKSPKQVGGAVLICVRDDEPGASGSMVCCVACADRPDFSERTKADAMRVLRQNFPDVQETDKAELFQQVFGNRNIH